MEWPQGRRWRLRRWAGPGRPLHLDDQGADSTASRRASAAGAATRRGGKPSGSVDACRMICGVTMRQAIWFGLVLFLFALALVAAYILNASANLAAL